MTWGAYYFFYDCSSCGYKYGWAISDMDDDDFSKCPKCSAAGVLVGETKDVEQGSTMFDEYERQ